MKRFLRKLFVLEIPEFCICAAIRLPDGEVVRGHRHDNCYDVVRMRVVAAAIRPGQADKMMEMIRLAEQGFVTSTDRFVDRKTAMILQSRSGRPSRFSKDGKYVGDDLVSEDLY